MRKHNLINKCKACNLEVSTCRSVNKLFCNMRCYANWQMRHPSNTGRTHFKKGAIPYNKNSFKLDPGKRQQVYYRRLIFEESNVRMCNRCQKEAKLVHHINHDKLDNRIDNLEPLCYSCHAKEHRVEKNFKYVGYEAVKVGKINKMKGGNIMKDNILDFE